MIQVLYFFIQIITGLIYMFIFNFIAIKTVGYFKNISLEVKYFWGYLGTLVFAMGFKFIWDYFDLSHMFLEAIVFGGIIVGILSCVYALTLMTLRLIGKEAWYKTLIRPLEG